LHFRLSCILAILYNHKPFDRARFTALLEQLGQTLLIVTNIWPNLNSFHEICNDMLS